MSKAFSSAEPPLLTRFVMLKPVVVVDLVVGTGNGTSLGLDLSSSSSAFAISFFSWARSVFATLGHILMPPPVKQVRFDS